MRGAKAPRAHRSTGAGEPWPHYNASILQRPATTHQSSDARIRLEGRIERLELAVVQLKALAGLLDDRWPRRLPWHVEHVHAVITGAAGVEEALAKVGNLAEAQAVVKALRSSRQEVERLAAAAWESLGESSQGLKAETLLRSLLARAPIDMGHSASAAGWYVGFTILISAAALAFNQSWPVIAAISFALLVSIVAWYFAPRRVWELRSNGLVIRTPVQREVPFDSIERVDLQTGTVVIHHAEEGRRVQESLDTESPEELAALLTLHRERKVPRDLNRLEDAVVVEARAGDVTGAMLAFSRGVFFVTESSALGSFSVTPLLLLRELALLEDGALEQVGKSLETGEFAPLSECELRPPFAGWARRELRVGSLEVSAALSEQENRRLERWFLRDL